MPWPKLFWHECWRAIYLLVRKRLNKWFWTQEALKAFKKKKPTPQSSSIQHPLYLLLFRRWISSRPFLQALKRTTYRTSWLDQNMITSLPTPAYLWPIIFSGTKSSAVEGSSYGRKGYAYLTACTYRSQSLKIVDQFYCRAGAVQLYAASLGLEAKYMPLEAIYNYIICLKLGVFLILILKINFSVQSLLITIKNICI